jgi:hypothetical protein
MKRVGRKRRTMSMAGDEKRVDVDVVMKEAQSNNTR